MTGPALDPSEAEWRGLVDRVLNGAPFERLIAKTHDGIPVRPLYPADAGAGRVSKAASHHAWSILTRIDHPDPVLANDIALTDLDNGADGLHLVIAGSTGGYGFGMGLEPDGLDTILAGVDVSAGVPIEIDAAGADFALALARRMETGGPGAAVHAGLDPLAMPAARFAEAVRSLAAAGTLGRVCVADGRAVHAAGGSEAQELALVLSAGVACLRALDAAGIAPEAGRARIGFRLAVDADEFLSIAKLRALRRLWDSVETACGLAPAPIHIHAETAWRMMTRRDPWVNVQRATIAAFSAAVGGADAISVLPFTQALGLPDAAARRLARNTQSVLREEAHIGKVADPAAGSGGFGALTDALTLSAWALFQRIELAGGLSRPQAIDFLRADVAGVKASRVADIVHRRQKLTGTSDFADPNEASVAVLMPRGGDAAGPTPFPPFRLAEPFEHLRDRSDARKAATGKRPSMFLATLGAPSDDAARVNFARTFFETAAIDVLEPESHGGVDAMVSAFAASAAPAACLCSTDALYARNALDAVLALRGSGAQIIALAGDPKTLPAPLVDRLAAAGVRHFVHRTCDAIAVLSAILDRAP